MEQPIIAFDNEWGEELLACDGTQMRQVILNIISNGIQAVEEKQAHINITCAQSEIDDTPSFVLNIEDNGPGIPAADRKTIFTPFLYHQRHWHWPRPRRHPYPDRITGRQNQRRRQRPTRRGEVCYSIAVRVNYDNKHSP